MNDTWYSLGSKHGPINGVKVVIVSKFVVLSLLSIALLHITKICLLLAIKLLFAQEEPSSKSHSGLFWLPLYSDEHMDISYHVSVSRLVHF